MNMKKVSLDTWVQLLGMLSVLAGLLFVELEMRQSQRIAIGAQQQTRAHWLLTGDKEKDGSLMIREDITPSSYADFVEKWLDLGANLVGGCCGTTAEFIEAIHERLAQRAQK